MAVSFNPYTGTVDLLTRGSNTNPAATLTGGITLNLQNGSISSGIPTQTTRLLNSVSPPIR